MASLSFNWPTFQQQHHNTAAAFPTPQELLPFHDNNYINHDQFSSFNNIPFQNPIKYPTLSSSNNPLINTTQQHFISTPLQNLGHEYYSYPSVPNVFDHQELFLINPMEQMQPELPTFPEVYQSADYYPMEQLVQPEPPVFPEIYIGGGCADISNMEQLYSEPLPISEIYYGGGSANLCSMEQLQPELPPLPEIYQGHGGGSAESNVIHVEEKRISAQSMAARVRRRKISEKTLELGKLIPGGHRMNTAEMFQAAFKYIKFMQAQVGVLGLMPQSTVIHSLISLFSQIHIIFTK